MKIGPKFNPVELSSGHLSEAGYDKDNETMYIRFTNGSIYTYSPVDEDKYKSLISASSAGAYFHKHIKNNKSIICKPLR